MNGRLSAEAIEVGEVVDESIAAVGGTDLLRRAVTSPAARDQAGAVLEAIGVWDLAPLDDGIELEVAAAVSEAAGRHGLPYPVAERLVQGDGGASVLLARVPPRLGDHLDLDLKWTGLDLLGRSYRLTAIDPTPLGTRLAPFSISVHADLDGGRSPRRAALLVVLQSWFMLGLLDRALADTVQYTREREQFGRPLIRFQAVGFQLAEMRVAVRALREGSAYALWSVREDGEGLHALTEALGLRVAMVRAADEVMHRAHQLHGAMGFTDEVDVSWLSRASQTIRRLPEGEHATRGVLVDLIERTGWPEFGAVGPARDGAH
nr:acyl-CoA dehydrogenase family protein [Microbacterium bovistercoris]